jgi:hypothetical protein
MQCVCKTIINTTLDELAKRAEKGETMWKRGRREEKLR